VEIRIIGLFYDAPSNRTSSLKLLREKLATLKRIP
jgi:hypothetical protein